MAKSFTIQGLTETDLMDILTCVGLTSRMSESVGYPAATIRRLDIIGSKLLTIAEEHGLDTRVKGNFEHLPEGDATPMQAMLTN